MAEIAERLSASTSGSIARAAASYDELPYTSNPFPQTHPGRLAAVAALFGLKPPDLATARILEVGCSSGGNIIPMAQRLPGADVLGIDISPVQVKLGRERIRRLGLANIRIEEKSITDIGREAGAFDFVICHGVYSWVPPDVQTAILRACKERLSPRGIAYVSYNVLPGWRLLQVMRDTLRLASPPDAPLAERVARGRQILEFLARFSVEDSLWGKLFRAEHQRLARLPDDYIGHEFLEDVNAPCAFGEFAEAAGGQGLAYLGEADVFTMLAESLGPGAGAALRQACGNDLIAMERHMDAVSGRTFRQTLLVHQENANGINRTLLPERLRGLSFQPAGDLRLTGEQNGGFVFEGAGGRSLTTSHPACKRAIERLIERRPSTSLLRDLLDVRPEPEDQNFILDALLKMLTVGLIQVTSAPVRAGGEAGDMPAACPLAALDAAAGLTSVTNLRHERMDLGVVAAHLLPLMDGTRGRDDLLQSLKAAAASGAINFLRDGARIEDVEGQAGAAAEHLALTLTQLTAAALIALPAAGRGRIRRETAA